MNNFKTIYILLVFCLISCKKSSELKTENVTLNKTEIDTSKRYQRINIPFYENGELVGITSIKAPLRLELYPFAAGYYHSMALRSDGTIACWGENGTGVG